MRSAQLTIVKGMCLCFADHLVREYWIKKI